MRVILGIESTIDQSVTAISLIVPVLNLTFECWHVTMGMTIFVSPGINHCHHSYTAKSCHGNFEGWLDKMGVYGQETSIKTTGNELYSGKFLPLYGQKQSTFAFINIGVVFSTKWQGYSQSFQHKNISYMCRDRT